MFQFGAAAKSAPEFVPSEDAREWIADGIVELAARLGEPARRPQLLSDPGDLGIGRAAAPGDLDSLFDAVCAAQEVVGQGDVELTVLELDAGAAGGGKLYPDHYQSLGEPSGKLLHTLRGPEDYLLLFTPAVFRKRELLFAGIARELGRIALDRAGLEPSVEDGPEALLEWEADAELAAVLLGMGVWVANGAYVFENACCGGGCGIDLRSLRVGLSMPEACYALALDAQRKGIRRRHVLRHLEPTQKTATKKCWSHLGKVEIPRALAAAEPEVRGQLGA